MNASVRPGGANGWVLLARRLRIVSSEVALLADEIEAQGSQLPLAAEPAVLTLREFATAIRRCEDTARELCAAGKVPGAHQARAGGRWVIPRAALADFLGQGRAPIGLVGARVRRAGVPDYRAQLKGDRSA